MIKKLKFLTQVAIILSVGIYFWQRLGSGLRPFGTVLTDLQRMLITERNLTYDQKMLSLRPDEYFLAQQIIKYTPPDAVIYFPPPEYVDPGLSIISYFIYPRIPIFLDSQKLLTTRGKNGELGNYILLYNDFPDFPVSASSLFLFDSTIPQTFENITIGLPDPRFSGKKGIIRL
ncbi:hypothetical protein A3D85_01100 [Candidatus Amesbacteria bacterium RIFCSPHIGHO2_02_FULL_47_9]|uniref:Uncharacterized protein n=1 Tax=Candidatus Amesbacteria bacterium RIFCSPHIGHO2_01_FULL_48_32b TaxID=1797253 RepID=A0A1F4YDF6_9BACT|nr:MAG: hypothetical protein A2876_03205 [Candidatus Amesbacteria bacterium RIFCSPHIGHO2_01_FULL_48_32b]OGD02942.1 MAG: hypothetical protein A3D85_01100 [Candidatus Amesbacteria bacterium RIFCSPHIGHO2_02_FULL_47_9]OGD08460.1 MAG: hypothetical protein A2899_01545 [Candidatus Amesbacteria bacterium RIFCSPLOWO2_01_FULL_49_25]